MASTAIWMSAAFLRTESERCGDHPPPVLAEQVPIRVRTSGDQSTPFRERLEEGLRVEAVADVACTDRHVLVVDIQRESLF